jgi:hypothetical protein
VATTAAIAHHLLRLVECKAGMMCSSIGILVGTTQQQQQQQQQDVSCGGMPQSSTQSHNHTVINHTLTHSHNHTKGR